MNEQLATVEAETPEPNASAPVPLVHGANPVAGTSASLIQMIERVAFSPEVDIDRMDKLLTFLSKIRAAEAEAAYTRDFSAMQPDLPSINANGEIVHNNKLIAKYAKWEDVNDVIKPILAEHSFVLNFQSAQDDKAVTITAVLKHNEGHKETAALRLPLDTSGAKNAVQAIGSTVSYGKRYTSGLVLNLTSRVPGDADDDGKAAGAGELLSEDQIVELDMLIVDVDADKPRLLKYLNYEKLADIPARRFEAIKRKIEQKRAAPQEDAAP